VVKTIEPERETFTKRPLKGILKQVKSNSKYKVDFNYFVETKTILKYGRLSTQQKIRCLVEEVEKRDSLFKTKIKKQKEQMKQRHLLRRQELSPRRVKIVSHILETLKRVNV